MNQIAKASELERSVLFSNSAEKAGIRNPAIVEKDFWVCFVLDYLFHRSPWQKAFIFKGGTSLSKAYHAIERFSEDIDLILDWRVLGYSSVEVWQDRSRNQQDKFNKMVVRRAAAFLNDTLVPQMTEDMQRLLGEEASVAVDNDDPDRCTVNFFYPRVHGFQYDYLRPVIRLEIGPLAEWVPSHPMPISPIVSEQYPDVHEQPQTIVFTIDAERTFWEKATILHKTASSFAEKGIPARYARHYYDLYEMSLSNVKALAFRRNELLAQDIRFKLKFYYSRNASYETARIGTLKLVPCDAAVQELSADYEHMKMMLYGRKPEFKEIMQGLSVLEHEINSLSEV